MQGKQRIDGVAPATDIHQQHPEHMVTPRIGRVPIDQATVGQLEPPPSAVVIVLQNARSLGIGIAGGEASGVVKCFREPQPIVCGSRRFGIDPDGISQRQCAPRFTVMGGEPDGLLEIGNNQAPSRRRRGGLHRIGPIVELLGLGWD